MSINMNMNIIIIISIWYTHLNLYPYVHYEMVSITSMRCALIYACGAGESHSVRKDRG